MSDTSTRTDLDRQPRRELLDRALERVGGLIEHGELTVPPGYAWQTELRAAWLILQGQTIERGPDKGKPVLDVVTQTSVANALLDMVVQGLSMTRKQCYMIPYRQQLTCQRSYFGDVSAAHRLLGLRGADAQIVYEGDVVDLTVDAGRMHVTRHETKLANLIAGAPLAVYCVLTFDAEREHLNRTEVMTWDSVQSSWQQSKQVGDDGPYSSAPHAKFGHEMAKRTVIRRALKLLVNSAVDDPLVLASWHRSSELAEVAEPEQAAEHATQDLPVDLDDDAVDVSSVPTPEPEPEPEPEAQQIDADTDDGRLPFDGPGF
jgi:recombination protein RecT